MCNGDFGDEMDIPLFSLIQLAVMNDEEVLTCRTLWSDQVLQASTEACARDIKLEDVLLALRDEAIQRGMI